MSEAELGNVIVCKGPPDCPLEGDEAIANQLAGCPLCRRAARAAMLYWRECLDAAQTPMTKRETLAEEFARLVIEYHAGGPGAAEAWNLVADFAVANSDTIYQVLKPVGNR